MKQRGPRQSAACQADINALGDASGVLRLAADAVLEYRMQCDVRGTRPRIFRKLGGACAEFLDGCKVASDGVAVRVVAIRWLRRCIS